MRKIQTISGLICIFILVFLQAGCTSVNKKPDSNSDKSFYVSPDGDDGNIGTIGKPWKTIDKINSLILKPGDRILFEAGKVFKGTLILDSLDNGLPGSKVIISSYGTGDAIIDGGEAGAILVTNCKEFVLKNLKLTGKGRKEGNTKDGIFISNSSAFIIDSIEISGFQHSGIHVFKGKDVDIKHVYAHDNGFAGINLTGTTIYSKTDFDNENIYIGYCFADNNAGDPTVLDNHSGNGILVSSARKCIIEYCEASNNGWDMPWTGNGPVGIWIWDCNNVIIQHCISHDNKTNPVAKDGGGFDLDGGVSESVIQYCVSYNNKGAGYGLFEFGAGKPWEKNVIRYNISSNDGIQNPGSVSIWKAEGSGIMRDCEIYNNTYINDTAGGVSLYVLNNCDGFTFRNNIFIYRNNLLFPGQKLKTEQFQGNCYWKTSGDKTFMGYRDLEAWASATGNEMIDGRFSGIFANPLLLGPGRLSLTDPSGINFSSLSGYSLKQESPLIDKALDLKTIFNQVVGAEDLIGTVIPQKNGYDVGAIERIK
jgi:hypothetical protein